MFCNYSGMDHNNLNFILIDSNIRRVERELKRTLQKK